LDADYELSDALLAELKALHPEDEVAGFQARFTYRVYGRPLRGTLYPPRIVLYRRTRAWYRSEGHGHRVSIGGRVESLSGTIYHDDRKPLSRWFVSQQIYARNEADYLLTSHFRNLRRADRIRRMGWPAPILVFLYTLFINRCILDGWPGWFYALQRLFAEI